MAEFAGIRCDQCKKVEELTPALEPPEGWIKLEICGLNGSKQTVCGIGCAQKWVTNRKKEKQNPGRKKDQQKEAFCQAHCSTEGEFTTHHADCAPAPAWAH